MNKKIIAANWKMNPATLAEAQEILERADEYLGTLDDKEFTLVFCPPFVFLEEVGKFLGTSRLSGQAFLGAQDIAVDDSGALTGEVSGPMLARLGARYVITGHSERRWKLGESNEVVNQKVKAALRNELTPIVCIGERVRDNNFKDFLKDQVSATFAGLSREDIKKCIIAYEPVWAISSNPGAVPDDPESAAESISIIKEFADTTFLYGGSVNSGNVRNFLSKDEVSGVLIGSASVNKDEFVKILSVVQEII
jgi:triosephosphate isomerase